MLTMVTIQNAQGDTLNLPLADFSNGYVVKDIQGLDPGKASLTSSSFAQLDGAQFQNARREPRNITMKLGFLPDYTIASVADLRTDLYRYVMPKTKVKLGFHTDGDLFAITDAYIENADSNMFSAEPEIDISALCYDPDLYAPDPVPVSLTTTSTMTQANIVYDGTSETGIIFSLTCPRNIDSIGLYNLRPDGIQNAIIIAGPILSGDILTVSTVAGNKSVNITRAGLTFSALYWLDLTSTWISLQQGINQFRAYVTGTPAPCTLTYTPKYGGI
jgi:hypothetical protein